MSKRSFESIASSSEAEDTQHQDKKSRQQCRILNPRATLLGLPGELRNRIYRDALIVPDRIRIDATYHTLPALLRTCREIRDEATSIHLTANRFGIQIHDLNPQAPVASSGHWYTRTDYTVAWSGVPNWENLKAWMKLRYSHELCGAKPSTNERHKVLSGVAGGASRMVKRMKGNGLSWEDVEPLLETYKEAVENSHGMIRFWR